MPRTVGCKLSGCLELGVVSHRENGTELARKYLSCRDAACQQAAPLNRVRPQLVLTQGVLGIQQTVLVMQLSLTNVAKTWQRSWVQPSNGILSS